ncbi:MAG TPA: VOC family protein [Arthrobacter sp.]|nr:VOC family protein [Arthrobacter sp.]
MLLEGINHVALLSHDVGRLGRFYETVFDAVVGETRDHGPGETMTSIRIGSATELNVFVIEGNGEADRQSPMWGRGRIDHLGLAASTDEAFEAIRTRLIDAGASDGKVNDFGKEFSIFFRDPDGLEGEVLIRKGGE